MAAQADPAPGSLYPVLVVEDEIATYATAQAASPYRCTCLPGDEAGDPDCPVIRSLLDPAPLRGSTAWRNRA